MLAVRQAIVVVEYIVFYWIVLIPKLLCTKMGHNIFAGLRIQLYRIEYNCTASIRHNFHTQHLHGYSIG